MHIRHVTIADRGHGDHGPPEAVGNGLEVGVRRAGLREINCTWKENHACEQKSNALVLCTPSLSNLDSVNKCSCGLQLARIERSLTSGFILRITEECDFRLSSLLCSSLSEKWAIYADAHYKSYILSMQIYDAGKESRYRFQKAAFTISNKRTLAALMPRINKPEVEVFLWINQQPWKMEKRKKSF